jgi:IS5 family transposase
MFFGLEDMLEKKFEAYLVNKVTWHTFDECFEPFYCANSRLLSKQIRLKFESLIFKYLRNISDESVVE